LQVEPAGAHVALDHRSGAEPQDAGDAGDHEEHGHGGEHRARHHALAGGVEGALHVATVALGGGLLVRERLHGAHGAQALRRVGGRIRERVLRPPRQPPHPASERDQRHHDDGDGEQHQQRQPGAGHDHHDERAREHDGAAQRLAHRGAGDRLDLRGVGGEAAHHLAGMRALEEGGAEAGDVAEHVGAHVGDDALAEPVDVVEAGGAGQRQHQADYHQHREVAIDEHAVLRGEAQVDDAADGEWDGQHRHRRDQERAAGERQLARVAHQVGLERQQRAQRNALARACLGLFGPGGPGVLRVSIAATAAQGLAALVYEGPVLAGP
jgi:hypothetical protein